MKLFHAQTWLAAAFANSSIFPGKSFSNKRCFKKLFKRTLFHPQAGESFIMAVLPLPPPPSKFLGNFYKNNLKLVEFEVKFIPNQEVNFPWNSLGFEQTFFTHFEQKSKTTRAKLISFLCYLNLM